MRGSEYGIGINSSFKVDVRSVREGLTEKDLIEDLKKVR